MKKIKTIIVSIVAFFIFMATGSAKQMTLATLGTEIEKTVGETSWAYVIGDYVFTAQHVLTIPDIIVASDSLNLPPEDEDKPERDNIFNQQRW